MKTTKTLMPEELNGLWFQRLPAGKALMFVCPDPILKSAPAAVRFTPEHWDALSDTVKDRVFKMLVLRSIHCPVDEGKMVDASMQVTGVGTLFYDGDFAVTL